LSGEPPRGLLNGRSPGGGLLLDPHVRFYGRPTLDSRMFIPPWYPLIAV